MSFATKLSHIEYADGTKADVMKLPKSDLNKFSLPGIMAVKMVEGVPTAFPAEGGHVKPEDNMLHVVWDNGPVQVCLALSTLLVIEQHVLPFVASLGRVMTVR